MFFKSLQKKSSELKSYIEDNKIPQSEIEPVNKDEGNENVILKTENSSYDTVNIILEFKNHILRKLTD